ncbi:hypothetical protein Sjap_020373 [Stephania japonica]|uniref:Polygalacturonase n=1 Tax=Stephania japonica TaxID=461633 RepID=A0AAP0F9I0_9MAGN
MFHIDIHDCENVNVQGVQAPAPPTSKHRLWTSHGISIGSLGKNQNEQGVQNVTVKTAVFTGTQNGVRIKTWAKPNQGFVRGVLNITGSSASEMAVNFDCSKTNPCTGIVLDIVDLTYESNPATASCTSVVGSATGPVLMTVDIFVVSENIIMYLLLCIS